MLSLRVLINLIVYLKLKFTMLSTQVLVQSYTWPYYSFHCAVKSHVYHVKYKDFNKYHIYAQC